MMIVFQFHYVDNGMYGSYCFSTIRIIDMLDIIIRALEFVNSSEKLKYSRSLILSILFLFISYQLVRTRTYILQEQ